MRLFAGILLLFCHTLLAKETFVFSLHSYNEAYQWTREQRVGFRETLNAIPDFYPSHTAEYLDVKRRGYDKEYAAQFVRYIHSKYKGYRPDIIYVTDDTALEFLIHNRQELFPNIPVVFSGINNQKTIDTLPKGSYTGVYEEKEVIPNIQLIRHLFPSEGEVLLLGDGSQTAQMIQSDIQHYGPMIKGLRIRYLNTRSMESVLDELKAYKGKSIVLTTIGGFHFANGHLVPLKEAIHTIVHAGDFHIFSMEDTFIQQGVLGGHADNGMVQGREAAKMLMQIIMHPKRPFPKVVQDVNGWIFDEQALKQHHIKLPADIAQQSVFINRPLTFYQKNEDLITNLIYGLMVTVIVSSATFIWYLSRSRRIIAKREAELVNISMSLNKAQELSHLGNWVWDMRANTLWWSDEIYRIFGLLPQEFKPTYEAFLERVHPDDREAVQTAVSHAITSHSEYSIIHRLIKMDGTIRQVHEEGSVDYEDEKPVKMYGTVQDITDAYEKEEIMREQAVIFDSIQDSIILHDLEGKFLYLNENAWKTRGYSYDEMMGMRLEEIIAPECAMGDPQRLKTAAEKMRKEGYVRIQVKHLCKNGDRMDVEVYAKLITYHGKPCILKSIRDITQQLKAQHEIEKFSTIVEQIDDMVVITDKNGIITYVNQAFCNQTGYTREEVLGANPRLLKSGEHSQSFYKALWKIILHGEVFRITIVNRKKNGDIFYENKTITPLKDNEGQITGFVSSGKDVTKETLLNREIEHMAAFDNLTGIFNRHKFEEVYALESERSRRFSQPLSLIIIDIDHFKEVNDTYGHDAGDEVLKRLATIIQKNIRKIDIFARWGGEEFLVLSPGTNLEEIQMLAEKLRLAVAKAKFPEVSHITISQGVSLFEEKDTFSNLLKRADKGLYYAKEHGRNQVGTFVG